MQTPQEIVAAIEANINSKCTAAALCSEYTLVDYGKLEEYAQDSNGVPRWSDTEIEFKYTYSVSKVASCVQALE